MLADIPRMQPTANWVNPVQLERRTWTCGYCGHKVAEDRGYQTQGSNSRLEAYGCPSCKMLTVFEAGGDWHLPRAAPGNDVAHVPPDLERLYNEARRCAGVGAFTAAVMACRAMLMHIACEKGAKPRDTFESYVQYLWDKHYIPPEGKALADYIKTLGRDANHKIRLMDEEDAEAVITCVEALLRLIYELPGRLPPKVAALLEEPHTN